MKKKWMYYAACSSNESADDSSSDKGDGGSLVVYSPNPKTHCKPLQFQHESAPSN